MDRMTVVQYLLDEIGGSTYLEIGVANGDSFCPIIAERKIAVDPIPATAPVRAHLLEHLGATYYQKTSDDFFAQRGHIFENQKLDVALVDGLHAYAQSLRDVENCLRHLSTDGVIIMHDCNPLTESAAAPGISPAASEGLPGFTGVRIWNGDVWKAIAYIRSYRDNLNVFVLECDQGLGIVTKGKPENMLKITAPEIDKMTFYDLDDNRHQILNLRKPEYLYEFMQMKPLAQPVV